MTKLEIVQRIAGNHNRIANIRVSGDDAILMGETLKDLRALTFELQSDIEAEEGSADTKEPHAKKK